MITNMHQAEAELAKYIPLVAQLPGEQMTLERIKPLLRLLDSPEKNLNVIHVAGTSGKTSTSYYIAALLTQSGKKVGLTVSPHIDTVRERVQINMHPISESRFCDYLEEFRESVDKLEVLPTYFEFLYAFAIWVFAKEKVDYAVVETGMGGLYDATNVVTNSNKVCVITDIGLDHTHILGNTIEAITLQKAGIIHEGNQVFIYGQSNTVNKLIKQYAVDKNANYNQIDSVQSPAIIGLIGYQKRNFLLAVEVYKYLSQRDKLRNLTSKEYIHAANINIPARLEMIKLQDKRIVLDGAHNIQKLESFIEAYKQKYKDIKPTVIFALKQNKEFVEFVKDLSKLSNKIVITAFNTTQDLPVISLDPKEVISASSELKGIDITSIPDHDDVVDFIQNSPEHYFVITGSFYLISQIRPKLKN